VVNVEGVNNIVPKILQYAQSVAIRAELLEACRNSLDKVSSEAARKARKHVAEAIGRLQTIERSPYARGVED